MVLGLGLCLLSQMGCRHGAVSQPSVLASPPLTNARPPTPGPVVAVAHPHTVARVEQTAQRILNANPELKLNPRLHVVGGTGLEITHHGPGKIVITEGLVNRCQTEGQLAALLSMELGHMAAEQEERAALQTPSHQDQAMMNPMIGPDRNVFEPWRETELHRQGYGRRQPRMLARPLDPILAARQYLTRAGYPESDLAAVGWLKNPHASPPSASPPAVPTGQPSPAH